MKSSHCTNSLFPNVIFISCLSLIQCTSVFVLLTLNPNLSLVVCTLFTKCCRSSVLPAIRLMSLSYSLQNHTCHYCSQWGKAYTSVIVAVHSVLFVQWNYYRFLPHLWKFFLFQNLATHTKQNLNSTITCSLYFFCRDLSTPGALFIDCFFYLFPHNGRRLITATLSY